MPKRSADKGKGKGELAPEKATDEQEKVIPTAHNVGGQMVLYNPQRINTDDEKAEFIAVAAMNFQMSDVDVPESSYITKAGRAFMSTFVGAKFGSTKLQEDMLKQATELKNQAEEAVGRTEKEIVALERNKSEKNTLLSTHRTTRGTYATELPNLLGKYTKLQTEYNKLEASPELTDEQKETDDEMRKVARDTRKNKLDSLFEQKKKAQTAFTEKNESHVEEDGNVTRLEGEVQEIEGLLKGKNNMLEVQKKQLQERADDVLKRQLVKLVELRKRKLHEVNMSFLDATRKAVDQNKTTKLGTGVQPIVEMLSLTSDTNTTTDTGGASRK